MNHELIRKYFSDQCTNQELELVLNWFQSPEGRAYLEEQISKDSRRVVEDQHPLIYPETLQEQMFSRIQNSKARLNSERQSLFHFAALLLVMAGLSTAPYWAGTIDSISEAGIFHPSQSEKPPIQVKKMNTAEPGTNFKKINFKDALEDASVNFEIKHTAAWMNEGEP